MYKRVIICIAILFVSAFFALPVLADSPDIKASSAILAAADGEQIIFDKNPDEKVYPSGLTKLMTALVAYETCGTEEIITVPENIKDFITPYEPSLDLKPGEHIKSGDLINAIIASAPNDAAITLAIHCGGSIEGFVSMMNERCETLGLTQTRFVNPTGIHNEHQYTTARDLLKLYKALCAVPLIRKAVESTNIKISATDKSSARTLWTSNSLISKYYNTNYIYPYAKGGKASASTAGGYSVISHASKGNGKLICIVLNSILDENVNYSFLDSANLFEYGFNSFDSKEIVRQGSIMREVRIKNAMGTDRILLIAGNTLKCFIQKGDSTESVTLSKKIPEYIFAPVEKGDVIGTMEYSYLGRNVGTVLMTAGDTVKVNPIKYVGNSILWFLNLPSVKAVLIILFLAVAVYAGIVIAIIRKASKTKRRRPKKQKSDSL
ncbi:MAG: D-alanyl-D-alanine carboxypeptidase DacB precursor [Firmicutes bacterium ADurb.Bin193]|nr:MAG: D-alanyl-D-alanine carboxypeptidase DacB precursor [Firmicutes bacterium ADurb.Bin193]